MKVKKRAAKMLFTAALSFALCIPAFAASYESGHITIPAGDKSYEVYSILYEDSKGTYRASAWAQVADGTRVPAQYIGVNAWLCAPGGQILSSTGYTYNDVSYSFWYACTNTYRTAARVYAAGEVDLYTGTQHTYHNVPESTYVGGTRALGVQAFPVNRNGESYGDVEMAKHIGYNPDLIAAIGNGGVEGYLRLSDMRPDITCEADILAYYKSLEDNPDIPLYDVNGTVIGTFTITGSAGKDIAPYAASVEEAQAAISASMESAQESCDQAKVRLAEEGGGNSVVSLAEIAEEPVETELIDGNYPVAGKLTYGTMKQAEVVGEAPDLVSVIATNGRQGWVTLKDFSPVRYLAKNGATTEELNAYISEQMGQRSIQRYIPVYDLDGNTIGEFPTGYARTPRG